MYASANIIPFSFGEIVYESELQIVTETSPSYIPVIYSPSESLQMVRKASFQNNFSKKSFFSISKRIFLASRQAFVSRISEGSGPGIDMHHLFTHIA